MAVAAQIFAAGRVARTGVVMPELAFDPEAIFQELEKRRILIKIGVHAL
jgi:hypothetical protein